MKKRHCTVLFAIFIALLLMVPGVGDAIGPIANEARGDLDPGEALEQAWRRALEAGSYRFLSTTDQTMIPRAVPEMIGQGDVHLTLENDGVVLLPDQAYIELHVAGMGREKSATLLRDGGRSFMLQNGELKPVDDTLSLSSATTDALGYLAAAEQVTRLGPPEGHSELTRYGFQLSGERFEAYVRRMSEEMLASDPGAPHGLTLRPSSGLQQIRGQGELWVNKAGLPVRQVLDIELPEANDFYSARLHLVVDLSAYGDVDTLPRAVQGAEGSWRLEGTLAPQIGGSQPDSLGVAGSAIVSMVPDEVNLVGATAPEDWRSRLAGILPLRIPPSSSVLFVFAVLAILVIRFYRLNPRRCYALLVLFLVPILVLTPLLQGGQIVNFVERQARAAEARQAAT
ncbi:MAG: hypothetical protein P9L91_00235, partial [Candidatus Zophobacter franzmannii]|nr:hypothetical protein [Candidatus Zophobacter franzmannii]